MLPILADLTESSHNYWWVVPFVAMGALALGRFLLSSVFSIVIAPIITGVFGIGCLLICLMFVLVKRGFVNVRGPDGSFSAALGFLFQKFFDLEYSWGISFAVIAAALALAFFAMTAFNVRKYFVGFFLILATLLVSQGIRA